jgi:ubiquinone/menaquinone biosynthesis C-methylase UbiE
MKRLAIVLTSLLCFGIVAYALVQGGRVDRDELARLVEVLAIEPGDVVADVGAGDGRWAVALVPAVGDAGRIYATEVDPNDLDRIRSLVERERASNVSVVEGDQNDTGLPDACCDAILLRRVYHHFQNPRVMQNELRSALRGDGRLLVIDFDTRRRWRRPSGIPESRDGHGISKEMLVSEMEGAGFVLIDDMKWSNGDYALVFEVDVID